MNSFFRARLALVTIAGFILSCALQAQTAPDPVPHPVDPAVDAAIINASQDPKIVRKGKRLYGQYCASCHGMEGVGGVAPTNLFDKVWHYGDRPSQIKASIADGVLEKGMPAWQGVLPEPDIEAVTVYLHTRYLALTAPPGT